MDPRIRVALFLLFLCRGLAANAQDSTPPIPAAGESKLSAQIQRLTIRDTVQLDGRTERVTDVQVFVRDPAGVAQFGQIGVPFIEGFGEISFDRVAIEKPDGRRVEVADGKVEDLNPFGMSGLPIPADLRIRRLTIPGLTPGDRLTYRMTLRERPLIPNVISGEFKFIVGPIALEQVYELDIPSDHRLNVWRRPDIGAQWESVPAPSGRTIQRLRLPAAIPMPKEGERAAVLTEPDVVYTTFSSWEDVGKWWWGISHDNFRPDAAIRAEAERLVKGSADLRARVDALHAFVSGQVRYLSVSFGQGRYEPRPASEVLAIRYGDCKGKHALLAALGGAVGIEIVPALIHTVRKDLHDEVPDPTQFDHLISVIRSGPDPADWLWIDSTSDLARPGHLRPSLRGKRTLVMSPEGMRVVKTPERPPFKTTWTVDAVGSIDPAGPIRARVRWAMQSDYEAFMRGLFRMTPRDKWSEAAKDVTSEWKSAEVTDVKAGDPADLREPFWVDYGVLRPRRANSLESAWSFWVPLPEISLPAPSKNPTSGEGIATIESSDEQVIRARFEMPEGMKARAPLSLTLDQPFATYRSRYAVEGRTLSVERILHVKQRTIAPEQRAAYEAFRDALTKDRKQSFPIDAFHATGLAAPAETADDLNKAGSETLNRGDAKAAETLFRQVLEKDAKHNFAWGNLGLALEKQGRYEEAVEAYSRQIEINPYDDSAYVNRGTVLAFNLHRPEEGEKDLLKQIEVSPLEPYAYRDLATIRTNQGRFAEAADLLDRAVAAKPSDSLTLLRLAWARARAGKGDVVGPAERAIAAEDRPQSAIIAARAVAASGDAAAAARLAREALPKLMAALPSTEASPSNTLGKDVLFLGEAWRLIGAAALAAGDLTTADRYLAAAFDIAFTEDAALELAALREKQGRSKEAAELREQAPTFSRGGAGSLRKGSRPASGTEPKVLTFRGNAPGAMIAARHIKRLTGPLATDRIEATVWLTVDAAGRVIDVRPHVGEGAAGLKSRRDAIMALTLLSGNPDKATFQTTRIGHLICFKDQPCQLGLAILADEVATVLER